MLEDSGYISFHASSLYKALLFYVVRNFPVCFHFVSLPTRFKHTYFRVSPPDFCNILPSK
jgi:hypothetical protein